MDHGNRPIKRAFCGPGGITPIENRARAQNESRLPTILVMLFLYLRKGDYDYQGIRQVWTARFTLLR